MGHYRAVSQSYAACFASLGYLHNQTSNIYTHLIASVVFLGWAVQTFNDVLTRYSTSEFNDVLVFGVFFAAAAGCFGSSALFHLFANHSAEANGKWLLFDLYGVFGLISATIVSGAYYGFYCDRAWWLAYSGGIIVISALCGLFCTLPRFRHHSWRNVRAVLFVLIGCYGILPMNHVAQRWGRPRVNEMIGWEVLRWEGVSYLAGALVYCFRIPERFTPGTFDVFGASHQIFHACAVLGAVLHYRALLIGFDYSHNPGTRQC
nr:hypothetical protein B0A51_05092 [Rachicladosporium sp. CCFEE 5018]